MTALFNGPKPPAPAPVVDPADAQNRQNGALARLLQGGGTNSTTVSSTTAPTGGARLPNLTGLT